MGLSERQPQNRAGSIIAMSTAAQACRRVLVNNRVTETFGASAEPEQPLDFDSAGVDHLPQKSNFSGESERQAGVRRIWAFSHKGRGFA